MSSKKNQMECQKMKNIITELKKNISKVLNSSFGATEEGITELEYRLEKISTIYSGKELKNLKAIKTHK